jgi:hypothetical protein
MADNVGYTPGTGATIAADDVGGNLYQRIKIGIGEDGTATDLSASNPMPMDTSAQSALSLILTRVLNILMAPLGYAKDLQRYRATATIESGTVTTVTTVTTLTTVTGLTNFDGLASSRLVLNQNMSTWAATHRARIT